MGWDSKYMLTAVQGVLRYRDRMIIAGSVDLATALSSLATRRPVFHSEKDFQVALAWEIQKTDPRMEAYLETRPTIGVHLDLAFERSDLNRYSAVEVKYLTRAWSGTVNGQDFDLKNHSARDLRRYDVVRDITRIEKFIASRKAANGAVVVLTNDESYVKQSAGLTANDSEFRIHEGSVLTGTRDWRRPTASTERQLALTLTRPYAMHWSEFSNFEARGQLWQLVVEVPGSDTPAGD